MLAVAVADLKAVILFLLVSELTDTQNEIEQKLANSSNAYKAGEGIGGLTPEQNMALQKINQSEKESSQVRAQLRALAGE